MPDEMQHAMYERLRPSMSDDRMLPYLKTAGFDADRALSLYVWNTQIGSAFHMVLQGVEIALRNRINTQLLITFGEYWWVQAKFCNLAGQQSLRQIEDAVRRLSRLEKQISNGDMVATLSFGFWNALLHRRWNAFWTASLRSCLPDLPQGMRRSDVEAHASRVVKLRNRISHHEPIHRLDLSAELKIAAELLAWLCAEKHAWLMPHVHVQSLLRAKP